MNEYGIVLENEDLKKYTTFGIGGKCKYLIEVKNENCLINLLKYLKNNSDVYNRYKAIIEKSTIPVTIKELKSNL